MTSIKSILTAFIVSTLLISCDEANPDNATRESSSFQNDSHYSPTADYESKLLVDKLEEIKIPDSVDASLVIAIYDQELPTKSRVVIHYKDSTRTLAIKGTYTNGQLTNKEDLTKILENEFKSKLIDESYLIKANHVYWTHSSGSLGTSWEYLRLDNIQNGFED